MAWVPADAGDSVASGPRAVPATPDLPVAVARAPLPRGAEPLAAHSAPISLRIPTIGVAAEIGALGLNKDKTVQVPTDPDDTGWYENGPTPGQVGSSVILGHVDSKSGPAVFQRLRTLEKGDEISVDLVDGAVANFVVDKLVTYKNAKFPAARVYGSRGFPELTLITCGGAYDRKAKSYTANVVVYSSLVSTTPAPWLPPTPGELVRLRS